MRDSQLCSQVEQALSSALASAASPVLRDLYVVRVEPLRGAALLRVVVGTDDASADREAIEAALSRAAGYLRAEVASSISRKRVPELDFAVMPPELRD